MPEIPGYILQTHLYYHNSHTPPVISNVPTPNMITVSLKWTETSTFIFPSVPFHSPLVSRVSLQSTHKIAKLVFLCSFIVLVQLVLPISLTHFPPNAAYVHRSIKLSLLQIMVCRLFGAMSSSKPIMTPHGTDFNETIYKPTNFRWRNYTLATILSRGWG